MVILLTECFSKPTTTSSRISGFWMWQKSTTKHHTFIVYSTQRREKVAISRLVSIRKAVTASKLIRRLTEPINKSIKRSISTSKQPYWSAEWKASRSSTMKVVSQPIEPFLKSIAFQLESILSSLKSLSMRDLRWTTSWHSQSTEILCVKSCLVRATSALVSNKSFTWTGQGGQRERKWKLVCGLPKKSSRRVTSTLLVGTVHQILWPFDWSK